MNDTISEVLKGCISISGAILTVMFGFSLACFAFRLICEGASPILTRLVEVSIGGGILAGLFCALSFGLMVLWDISGEGK